VKPLSSNVVKAEEDPEEISFVVEHEAGWVDLLAGPLIVAGTGFLAWRDRTWWLVALCAAGIAWTVIHLFKNWSTSSASKLTITSRELVATVDLIRFPKRVIRFRPDDVKSLGYSIGGKHEPSGLYLNETCVFDGLDRKQAEAIVFRIFYKFPNIGSKDETQTSLLHGDDSGIVSLGLSGSSITRNP
jgi:hypothetical protein